MSKPDLNEIAKVEKAIKEKYGSEAIQNPKASWDKEKEQKYLEELKNFHKKTRQSKVEEQMDGFTVKARKTKHQINRSCPVCDAYSLSARDDIYMVKFNCCFDCYVRYVEDREERWKSGWRPNN